MDVDQFVNSLNGSIVHDFELYLRETGLKKNEYDRDWTIALKNKMIIFDEATKEDCQNATVEDMKWWIFLKTLQERHGNQTDLFGEYMELTGRTNFNSGQFYTPMNICNLVNKMNSNFTEDLNREVLTVNDCAAGTGRLLISHFDLAKEAQKDGFSPFRYFYVTQDIDYTNYVFTALNFSLRNMLGLCICGDTMRLNVVDAIMTMPTEIGNARWIRKELSHELVEKFIQSSFIQEEAELDESQLGEIVGALKAS
jgi:hypothetical protein